MRILSCSILCLGLIGCKFIHRAPKAASAALTAGAADPPADDPDDDDGDDDAAAPFLGVVLAGETVDVAAKSDGRIESLRVSPGDHVKRGAVVAVLDRRLLRKSLSVARAELAEAEGRYQRRVPLAQTEATISREELSVSRMQVLEQRSRVDQLSQALGDTELRAPFDGTVAARFVDSGSMTGAGRPIVRIISGAVPRVRFAIPESRGGLVPGAALLVTLEGVAQPIVARVESLAPEVDSAARMTFALASLQLPPALRNAVRSGQVAHVTIPVAGGGG